MGVHVSSVGCESFCDCNRLRLTAVLEAWQGAIEYINTQLRRDGLHAGTRTHSKILRLPVETERKLVARTTQARFILAALGLHSHMPALAPLEEQLRRLERERLILAAAVPTNLYYSNIETSVGEPVAPGDGEPLLNDARVDDPRFDVARPIVFAISPALPDGMTMNERTGAISGCPITPEFAGYFTVLLSCRLGLARHRLHIFQAYEDDPDGNMLQPSSLESAEAKYQMGMSYVKPAL